MSDIDTVKAIYQAMGARDFDKIFELIDETCVQTQDERLPWGGRHEGHDGFATFGLTLTANIDSKVTIDAIFEADGEVIQVRPHQGHGRRHRRAVRHPRGAPVDDPRRQGRPCPLRHRHPRHARGPRREGLGQRAACAVVPVRPEPVHTGRGGPRAQRAPTSMARMPRPIRKRPPKP